MTVMDQGNAHDLVRLLEDIPEFDGYKIELIDGKITMLPSATPFHNFIQSFVTGAFVNRGWWSMTEQALISSISGFEPKPDVAVTTAEQVEGKGLEGNNLSTASALSCGVKGHDA